MKKVTSLLIIATFWFNTKAQVYTMCTDNLTSDLNGNLEDSGGPGADYSNSENCGFLIDPGCADSITLTFNIFDIESGWDFFNVYDGIDNSGNQLLNATGSVLPSPVTATSGTMYIEFISDGVISAPGFDVSWNVFVSPQSPVTAGFSVSNSTPDYQETISFTDNSTSNPNSWFWDFGDGNTSTLQNPNHTYFTSGPQTVTLISANCSFADTTSQVVTVNAPPFSISPDTVQLNVDCSDGPISSNFIFNNTGASSFGYEIASDLPLDTVLNRTNRFYDNLTSLVPSLFLFTNGDVGSSISDGGNDMYDTGNQLNTNISGGANIPYSDNLITNSTDFGPNGKYFTVKNPGLFLMAADLDGVNSFDITGNLGADGSGNSDGTVLTANAFGSTYRAFINRTHGAGDPSINRMIIVVDNPTASHTFLNTTDDEDHEVTGLASSERIYYLLFAAESGLFIDDAQMQIIFEEFLSWLESIPSYVTISPLSDTIAATSTSNVSFSFDPTGLAAGTYFNKYTIKNTTAPFATYYFYSEVNVTGVANLSVLDSCIDFGSILQSDNTIDTLMYTNLGCANLNLNSVATTNPDFSIVSYDTMLLPGETSNIIVNFDPSALGLVSGDLIISTNANDTSVCLNGRAVGTPLTLSSDSLYFNLDCGAGAQTQTIIFNNDSTNSLNYEMVSGLPLDTVLNRTNRFYEELTSLVPSLFLFSDGIFGSSISDGGNDMYDTGNKLNTDISVTNDISYSDNSIINSTDFGPNGKYFTVKNPGLFVMAADVDGINSFNITGNLGADGSGNSDGTILTTSAYGSNFRAFINRTYNAGDPSINRMIIVVDNPTASHTFLTTTGDEDHEVTGLASSERIYYLLFAADGGLYVDDAQMQIIFEEFVSWLETIPDYLTVSPLSSTINGNSSLNVDFTIDPSGVQAGIYETEITVNNTTPPFSQHTIQVVVEITGTADYILSDACLDIGITPPGDVITDTLFYENTGCDDLVINGINPTNPDFSIISYDTTIAPGQTGEILISFNPTSVGTINASLDFVTNVQDSLICITGEGTNITSQFTFSDQDACTAEISFTNNTIGQSTSWSWNFGDGNTSNLENPVHRYNTTGTFPVTFIACNALGCDTIIQNVTVGFILDYSIETTGILDDYENIDFTLNGMNIISNTWNFGDGVSLPGINASHIYTESGTYIVKADLTTSEPCFITLYDTLEIGATGIKENISNYEIFPNPTSGHITVEVQNFNNSYDFIILNNLGQKVYAKNNVLVDKMTIDLELDKGTYLILIEGDDFIQHKQKLIIN